ncbi:MAG: hypothetical protein DWQ31_02330 [Planctomycetota bacterium]|nr:MAG: hypothetical protein DWQ31_02330 [Planctomycetota bacterium]REJ88581.1 MAG: hypothetical protein DWQ35_19705 [Planctomycetota bacterium]REK17553.1 MAG: hypothetical protein DWQ42_22100 [Planctomycetota bacterium]REK47462.1 MAG: hypothetical protein DWQ46_04335 [Planctomycetota bacterium]
MAIDDEMMIMTDKNENCELSEALKELEICLETPVVPGELESWAHAANAACEAVGIPLRNAVEDAHPEVFRQILQQDPELAQRVEELRSEDQVLLRQFDSLKRQLHRLATQASAVEPRESRLDSQLSDVTKEGLAFVINTRSQEQALSTWYVEAYNRDRGIGD